MNILTSIEYYHKKKALLLECLNLSAKLPGSVEAWEAVPGILAERETALLALAELEEAAGPGAKSALSQEMKGELDALIRQIRDLDEESARLIRKAQKSVLESLRANSQGWKLTQYAQTADLTGRKLDYKK
jgi:hypothetical protein